MGRTRTNSDARRRIVETADRLFQSFGIRAVGIDRIIAESGVAKMTLYAHFRSKDDLILATLQLREDRFMAEFEAGMDRHLAAGLDRFGAVFASLKDWFETPTFRGCAFINASVELADPAHPGSAHARQHKDRFQASLSGLIGSSLGADAARQAPAIALLIEGAIVTALIQGSSQPAEVAHLAALKLIAP